MSFIMACISLPPVKMANSTGGQVGKGCVSWKKMEHSIKKGPHK